MRVVFHHAYGYSSMFCCSISKVISKNTSVSFVLQTCMGVPDTLKRREEKTKQAVKLLSMSSKEKGPPGA